MDQPASVISHHMVKISDQLWRQLVPLAQQQHRNTSNLVNHVLALYVEQMTDELDDGN